MAENKSVGRSEWVDPDDAPELSDAWFDQAEIKVAGQPAPRGRPRAARPKRAVNIRLSQEVLEHFQAAGPGWQTRIDEALLRAVARDD